MVLPNLTISGGGLGAGEARPQTPILGRCGGARVPSGCPLHTLLGVGFFEMDSSDPYWPAKCWFAKASNRSGWFNHKKPTPVSLWNGAAGASPATAH